MRLLARRSSISGVLVSVSFDLCEEAKKGLSSELSPKLFKRNLQSGLGLAIARRRRLMVLRGDIDHEATWRVLN